MYIEYMNKYISNHNRNQLYYLVLYLLLVATIPIRSARGGDLHMAPKNGGA